MIRRGGERFVETGDILRNSDKQAASRAIVRRRHTVLQWFTGPAASQSSRVETDELNEQLGGDTWDVIAEPADEHRRTLGLFTAFIQVAPRLPLTRDSRVDVSALSPSDRRAVYTLRWCDDTGALSQIGKDIVRYYRQLDGASLLSDPPQRVDDIGVGGFVKRARRYDQPVVLDALLSHLDKKPYSGDLTAYRADEAYIDFHGRAQDATDFLQELQGLGFAADFREDGRFDVGADPSRLTVDISVPPSQLSDLL